MTSHPGVVHVDDFEAAGDAVLVNGVYVGTDDTDAFRTAAATGAAIILVGPRNYMLHDLEDVLTLNVQELRGCGRGGVTRLCKKPLLSSETQPAACSFIRNNGGMVRDLDILIQKSGKGRPGSQRMNALLYTGTNPRAENVDVYDVTGYGHFAAGMTGGYARHVSATNADVLYEAINGTGFTFEDFRWFAGAADCGSNVAVEMYQNAAPGLDRITLRDGSGEAFAGARLMIGLTNGGLTNLTLDNVRFKTTASVNCFSVAGGAATRLLVGLNVSNCSFESVNGNGLSIDHVEMAKFTACNFIGSNVGYNLNANCKKVQAVLCYAKGAGYYGVLSSAPASEVTFDGTAIGGSTSVAGTIGVSATTLRVP